MDVKAQQNRSQDLRERPKQATSRTAERSIAAVAKCDEESIRSVDGPPEVKSFGLTEWLFLVALVAAVFLVYIPCWHGGFVFDDDLHLLNNPVLQPGGLAKIWVPGSYLNYWPLTYTAYWIQFHLWSLQPLGYHLVNLGLHAFSAQLVWRVLARLNVPGAMFAAAIFALHPVNVESVAWISQLKGDLALPLALASMLFYLGNERRESRWRYGMAILAFLLSALAKGSALTLPIVLLACAWWQRGRIERRDLLRIVPYLLIGTMMVCIELWGQRYAAQGEAVRLDDFFSRLAIAGAAVWFYLGKLMWPAGLCPIYPRWTIDEYRLISYLPGIAWIALLALAWWRRRSWGRPVVMLIVCYSALLLPVLGFVNITFMRYSLVADHWQYSAMIVPCAAVAGAIAMLVRRFRSRAVAIAAAVLPCAAILVGLAVVSWRQSGLYGNAFTFFETTVARNPRCWLAENNLGNILLDRGETDLAIAHFRKALELKPDLAAAHNNYGNALMRRGETVSATVEYERAVEISPGFAQAHNNLGNALVRLGKVDRAIGEYQKALDSSPDYAETHYDLGVALASRGDLDAAILHYQKAIDINPDYGEAQNNLAAALLSRGHADAAAVHFQKALEEIKPEDAGIHNNLALALAASGQLDAAIAHYRRALEINPNFAEARANLAAALSRRGGSGSVNAGDEKPRQTAADDAAAHCNLATTLARKGDVSAAIAEYQKALEINPDYALAHNNLGAVLISGGQVASGIAHLRRAIEIHPDYAEAHFNLANGLASREEFDAAIAEYEKTLAIKPDYAAAQKNLAAVRSARKKSPENEIKP